MTISPKTTFLVFSITFVTALFLFSPNSPTHAAITGTGDLDPTDPTTWTDSTIGYIGRSSTGEITVDDAGTLLSGTGYLGYNSGSFGTATVSGDDSTWLNRGKLHAGFSGNGILNVKSGGQVNNIGQSYIGYSSNSFGTATIADTGSKFINGNNLFVGLFGTGTLNIEAGGQVSNSDGCLGAATGSYGTATVTGPGSIWTNTTNLYVGYSGSGKLTVEDGGTVIVGGTIYASSNNLLGNGSISANGGIVDADLVFDAAHASQGMSNFGSGGTLTIAPSTSNPLGVGYKNSGTLRIIEGVTAASSYGYLGYNSDSSGIATVNGLGSKWTSGYLYVGYKGSGTLNVEAGGQVSNIFTCYIGDYTNSSGTVHVTGPDSKMDSIGYLQIGFSGKGELKIEAGGLVGNVDGYLGKNSGSSGIATVIGSSSKWTNSGTLYIGDSGSGVLNIGGGIANDGLVVAKSVRLGYASSGSATCNLNGGSLQASSIAKGTGTATFNWSDGIIRNYDANTNLTVSGTNSLSLNLAATGTHAFNIDAGRTGTVSAVLSDATSGGTLAKQGDGLLVLSAANTYSGTTTIESGQLKLVAGGDIAFSSEIINRAGFLIDGGNHTVQKITGSGTTQVLSGSLTAQSIVQDTLTIGGTTNAVPEPSSLILLALSALAILAWRKSREM